MHTIHQDLYVDFEFDFYLYGLQTTVSEYKLAWELNRAFKFRFKKKGDLCLDFVEQDALLISNFAFNTTHCTFRLLKNRAFTAAPLEAYLLPELKEWDYFVLAQSPSTDLDQSIFLKDMQAVKAVQQAHFIHVSTIEHKENLLF